MKPGSQNARLLEILRRGPATNADIHREAGHMIVNSRVAELRSLGYQVECEHVGGTGPDAFVYTLLSEREPGVRAASRLRSESDGAHRVGSAGELTATAPTAAPAFHPLPPAAVSGVDGLLPAPGTQLSLEDVAA